MHVPKETVKTSLTESIEREILNLLLFVKRPLFCILLLLAPHETAPIVFKTPPLVHVDPRCTVEVGGKVKTDTLELAITVNATRPGRLVVHIFQFH